LKKFIEKKISENKIKTAAVALVFLVVLLCIELNFSVA